VAYRCSAQIAATAGPLVHNTHLYFAKRQQKKTIKAKKKKITK